MLLSITSRWRQTPRHGYPRLFLWMNETVFWGQISKVCHAKIVLSLFAVFLFCLAWEIPLFSHTVLHCSFLCVIMHHSWSCCTVNNTPARSHLSDNPLSCRSLNAASLSHRNLPYRVPEADVRAWWWWRFLPQLKSGSHYRAAHTEFGQAGRLLSE